MHKNNFDFLRLVFAIFVTITHSIVLTNAKEWDFLSEITNGQTLFSYLGVRGFFIISGYLIFQSLIRSKNLLDYFWKRFLRLFPALFILLLLTLLLAWIPYDYSFSNYIHNKTVWTYLPNNLSLFFLQNRITGVFTNNPFKPVINGSLWTISYEFSLYIFLASLFIFKKNKQIITLLLTALFIFLLIGNIFFIEKWGSHGYILGGKNLLNLGAFFVAGAFLASIQIEKNKYLIQIILFAFSILVASFLFTKFYQFQFILLPLIIIPIGIKSTKYLNNIGTNLGDLSYGIYIYSFPIQQTLLHYFKYSPTQLFITSLPIILFFSYFSWHLIERKALKYKKLSAFQNNNKIIKF